MHQQDVSATEAKNCASLLTVLEADNEAAAAMPTTTKSGRVSQMIVTGGDGIFIRGIFHVFSLFREVC